MSQNGDMCAHMIVVIYGVHRYVTFLCAPWITLLGLIHWESDYYGEIPVTIYNVHGEHVDIMCVLVTPVIVYA